MPPGRDRQPRRSACRCRPPRCRRSGTPRTASARPTFADFPGFYDTSDAGMVDEEGYVWVMGRTDDIINVAGHRLSTGAMEEVLASHPDVAECAVIGVKDSLKGQAPMGLVVLKSGVATERGRDRRRAGGAGARAHRPGRRLQGRAGGAAPAEDPQRQDPARDHAQHRRRREPTPCRRPSTTRPSCRSWRARSGRDETGCEVRAGQSGSARHRKAPHRGARHRTMKLLVANSTP